jgi:hypothetical protein
MRWKGMIEGRRTELKVEEDWELKKRRGKRKKEDCPGRYPDGI